MRRFICLSLAFYGLFYSQLSFSITQVENRDSLLQKFGVQPYFGNARLNDVKIAILDNGFYGYAPDRGYLPSGTEVPQLTSIPQAASNHGLGMAQIVWAICGQAQLNPKFYLLNSNGFSNFKASIQFVIDKKIDIVLYSQVWPFGSNFDGTGLINSWVSKATQAGVIWINAAGNDHKMIYNGGIERQRSNRSLYLEFSGNDYLEFENLLDENSVTLTLSWNDFKSDETYNTSKDLDLFIFDLSDRLVSSSEYIQRGEAPKSGSTSENKLSSHAREQVVLNQLDRGKYRIRVKANSKNFDLRDRFRILVKSEKPGAVRFQGHTDDDELMSPADHSQVITVGENSDESSTGVSKNGKFKPEVILSDSVISFSNGDQVRGSSTAAAIFAGIVALFKASVPELTTRQIQEFTVANTSDSTLSDLKSAEFMPVEERVIALIPEGGELMVHKTKGHFVILTSKDPFDLSGPQLAGLRREDASDRVVYSPRLGRWLQISNRLEYQIRPPLVEFRQRVIPLQFWKTPSPDLLRRFVKNLAR